VREPTELGGRSARVESDVARAGLPDELLDHVAIHGGYWRRPYNLHSPLVYTDTGILGLTEAYAPKLR
jgi:hypothetical protein